MPAFSERTSWRSAATMNETVVHVHGQSAGELHGYFQWARQNLDRLPAGADEKTREQAHGKCSLFATRLTRAPAVSIADILLKIEAAEWLAQDHRQTLEMVRNDLLGISGSSQYAGGERLMERPYPAEGSGADTGAIAAFEVRPARVQRK